MKNLKYLALIPILFIALFFIGIRVGKSLHARADLIATVKPGTVWARDFPRKNPFEEPKTSLYIVKAVALDYVQYAYTFNTSGITNISGVPDVDTLDYFLENYRHATPEDFEREWPKPWISAHYSNIAWTNYFVVGWSYESNIIKQTHRSYAVPEDVASLSNRLCALEAWRADATAVYASWIRSIERKANALEEWKAKHEAESKPKEYYWPSIPMPEYRGWNYGTNPFILTNWQSIPAITNLGWSTNVYLTNLIVPGSGIIITPSGSNIIVIEGKGFTVTNVIRKNWNTLELP